jgi:hypothetical protein
MKTFLFAGIAILAGGCGSTEVAEKDSKGPSAQVNQSPAAQTQGITPITTAPVGIAPVTGYEGVQGSSGGGTGQAAKDMARRVATPQPPPVTSEAGE